ncbi:flagellar hook-associated protein 2 [Virgibacillus dakarensis]|uniref:Flagellar hook-associated protein 2 n=1 Tax=Lentibacillus populi TaxID=1827502 RepID=A0A9W5U019_9BACI|nr:MULTISPECIES: flagellar hook-associated protein 2 [Bacillaceae]MBT2216105.1 flagellar hook-associated protein 2 [Virgibacillus dakarensis]MTW86379.1 flagellar hook-associated protein 2 [Virgibacillus dakarensis]GGB55358.1 flagellar hook-associated protein 2 [Lentibacillus populi]
MRIGGLASGMDIDQLVNKLMAAERMPLDRMEQDRTTLTWKRDSFRDINKSLLELDEMMYNMKLSTTYKTKLVSSSQEGAVTATGSTSSTNGTYNIAVTQLASSAIRTGELDIDPDKLLKEVDIDLGSEIKFSTYDEKEGNMVEHTVQVTDEDTLNSILNKINKEDKNVRAFYDSQSKKVFLETTRTGDYNKDGAEIVFDKSPLFVQNLNLGEEKGGKDAIFTYNDVEMTSKDNSYKLNGITFQFKNVTDGSATLTVKNDADAAFDSIMKFIDKYNEVVEKLNGTQQEEKYRDYKPLTEEQKKEMSEDEIELWEEKAKSGILRGESAISDGLFAMRRSWYANVKTGGKITSLTQLGITTSSDYLDGGKLIVKDEAKLKEALRNDPDNVYKLFSNDVEGDDRGIINRLDDAITSTINKIEERAGKGYHTLENYTLGKQMKSLNKQIDAFEDRLVQVENRYWSQFTAMEKAIQRMNQQSTYLMQQFGGQ